MIIIIYYTTPLSCLLDEAYSPQTNALGSETPGPLTVAQAEQDVTCPGVAPSVQLPAAQLCLTLGPSTLSFFFCALIPPQRYDELLASKAVERDCGTKQVPHDGQPPAGSTRSVGILLGVGFMSALFAAVLCLVFVRGATTRGGVQALRTCLEGFH